MGTEFKNQDVFDEIRKIAAYATFVDVARAAELSGDLDLLGHITTSIDPNSTSSESAKVNRARLLICAFCEFRKAVDVVVSAEMNEVKHRATHIVVCDPLAAEKGGAK